MKYDQIYPNIPGLDCAVEDFSNILREQDTNSSTVERYVKIFLWVEEFLCWAIFFSAHVNRSLNWESLKSLRFLPEITVILDKHWFLEENAHVSNSLDLANWCRYVRRMLSTPLHL